MYIKRDKFSKPIDVYFTIRKAKDGKFYLINPGNNELYIRKNKTEKYMPVIKEADPVELERHDLIFFEDPQKYIKIDIDEHIGHIARRQHHQRQYDAQKGLEPFFHIYAPPLVYIFRSV